jgi:RimJ/RimL family protein N-acetyltransferase
VLAGRHVQLEPLDLHHVDALVSAAAQDRTTYDFTNVPDDRAAMTTYVQDLVRGRDAGEVVPFAQRRAADSTVVGCTRFMELRQWRGRDEPDEVEIGGTWLAASAQRTPVNTEAKLLLLRHAFETWGVWRVQLCTDARNARSRAAIERIGATFEGVLRNHRPTNRAGLAPWEPRDTAVFAITDADWPAVRSRLEERLA